MAQLTKRELDLMSVLWNHGSATVTEVLADLPDEIAYSTVMTIMRTLEAKGHVRHEMSRPMRSGGSRKTSIDA